jgi:hypothetical protein
MTKKILEIMIGLSLSGLQLVGSSPLESRAVRRRKKCGSCIECKVRLLHTMKHPCSQNHVHWQFGLEVRSSMPYHTGTSVGDGIEACSNSWSAAVESLHARAVKTISGILPTTKKRMVMQTCS